MWVRYDIGPSMILPLQDQLDTPANAVAEPSGAEVLFVPSSRSVARVQDADSSPHPTPEELLDPSVGRPVVRVRETPAEELPTVTPAAAPAVASAGASAEVMVALQTLRISVEGYASTVAQIVKQTDEIRRSQARFVGDAEELVSESEGRLSAAISENRRLLERQIGTLTERLGGAEQRLKSVAKKASDGQKTRMAAIEERLSMLEATFDYLKTMVELLNWKARAAEYALNQATRQLQVVLGADALQDVKAPAIEAAKTLAPSKRAALERVKWYAGRAFKLNQALPSS